MVSGTIVAMGVKFAQGEKRRVVRGTGKSSLVCQLALAAAKGNVAAVNVAEWGRVLVIGGDGRRPRRAVVVRLRRERFELVQISQQLIFRGPAGEVELQHLQCANGGFPPDPKTDQQTGDDAQVDLDRHAVGTIG
jgi:hypothetical protein